MKSPIIGLLSGVALATLGIFSPAQAANVVIGSTASTTLTTTIGAIGNVTNQSGLSTPYTSGVTDFDTYSATTANSFTTQLWFTSAAGQGGFVTFDLGALYNLNAFALWNVAGTSGVRSFTLFTDTDTNTGTLGTQIGNFSAVDGPAPSPLQRFTFASTVTTRYIQMRLNTNGGGFFGTGYANK